MENANYHLKGFYLGEFKKNKDLESVLSVIHQIHKGSIKEGFELVEKYKYSKDLRPDVYNYDDAFVDILFSNDIPKLLKEVVGRNLYLAHIQLRISYKGESSYMSWHRDTHVYGGKVVGNIPPVHKIIFYPNVDGNEDDKIKIIPGSHRKVFTNRFIDYLQVFLSKRKTVKSSDSKFMLFNTELFHHVVPEVEEKGSFRLIYSFAEKEQLGNYDQTSMISGYQERL